MQPNDDHLSLPESLRRQFAALEQRLWSAETVVAVCGAAVGLLASYALLFLSDRVWNTPVWLRAVFTLAGAGVLGWFAWRWAGNWVFHRRDLKSLSELVQRHYKRLGDRLLGIVELSDESKRPADISPSLCRAAIRQVAGEAEQFDFTAAVDARQTRKWVTSMCLLLAPIALAWVLAPQAGWNALQRWAAPTASITRYTFVSLDQLPATLVVPHGEAFEVAAGVTYRSFWKPARATGRFEEQPAVATKVDGDTVRFKVSGQTQPGRLALRIGDERKEILIQPTHRPALKQLTANIEWPAYLQYSTTHESVQTGSLSLLEGSRITLTGVASRPLASAQMKIESQKPEPLAVKAEKFNSASSKLDNLSHAALTWRDELGLDSGAPWLLALRTQKDQPSRVEFPDLALETSILETDVLPIKVAATDDYGVRHAGFVWELVATGDVTNKPAPKDFTGVAKTPHEKKFAEGFMFSPAVLRVPPDSSVELHAVANDFFPERKVSESPIHFIHVVSLAKHAEMVRQQLEAIFARLEEITRAEEGIANQTRDLKDLPKEKLAGEDAAKKAGEQADEQERNARNLDQLSQEGQKAVKEAIRNPTFTEADLKQWTKSLQNMKEIAAGDMSKAQQALKDAQQSQGERPEQLAKAEKAEQDALDKLEQLQKEMNQGLDNLQAMTLAQRLRKLGGTEQEIEGKLQKIVPETIGLTAKELPDRFKRATTALTKDQSGAQRETATLKDELGRFAERTQKENYGQVNKEMTEANAPGEMDKVRAQIEANISMEAMKNLATWSKKFGAWADVLDPPKDGGGGGGGQGGQQSDDILKLLMAYIRMRAVELNVHDRTRLLEEQKATDPGYAQSTKKLAENQRTVREDLFRMQLENKHDFLKEPLLDATETMRGAEIQLFKPDTGKETTQAEVKTIEHLSDIINLINEQIQRNNSQSQSSQPQDAAFMMQMVAQPNAPGMTPGQQPGQQPGMSTAGGTTNDRNRATPGDPRSNLDNGARKGRTSGATRALPAEFREAIENFFKSVEQKNN